MAMKGGFASTLVLFACLVASACGTDSTSTPADGAAPCAVVAGLAPEPFVTSDKCGAPVIVPNESQRAFYEPVRGAGGTIPPGVYDVTSHSGLYDEIPGSERLLVFADGRFARTRIFSFPGFKGTASRYMERSSGRLATSESTLTFEKDCSLVSRVGDAYAVPTLPRRESWNYGVLFKCGGPVVLRRDRDTGDRLAPTSVFDVRR
jgi:hypothetical protein